MLGVVADLNVARQAMPLGCRWVALPLRVGVTGCGQRGALVVASCSSWADARSNSSKEGAARPPVNYAILWLTRVTE